MAADASHPDPITVAAPAGSPDPVVLTPPVRALVAGLERRFGARRRDLLARRHERQAAMDAGALPDFDPATAELRSSDWQVATLPDLLLDRRVEITGPVDRKMVINGLNSGARVFMADFEDASSPTWANMVEGQANLRDAVAGGIEYRSPQGRVYRLAARTAVLMVRPRGWHLDEKHVLLDGVPVSASLFDAAVFCALCGADLHRTGRGPFLYLPKLEHAAEAALWDEALAAIEAALDLPRDAIKVTVLIETLPAAFQMDEILHALRGRVVALNCGRWDYIFSTIKTLRAKPDRLLPDRGQVTMAAPFLRAYADLLVRTCHRRGALAMGGMAAQIPIRGDEVANSAALDKVRADKLREVRAGHDGTWVAHPDLIAVAQAVFDTHMPGRNQREVRRDDVAVGRDALLDLPSGPVTAAGYRGNVEVAVRYLAAWLDGLGCVPIHHLMEDAATAEIARAQLWQWQRHGARLDDGRAVDGGLFDGTLEQVLAGLRAADPAGLPGHGRLDAAAALLAQATHATELPDFLTLPAYAQLP